MRQIALAVLIVAGLATAVRADAPPPANAPTGDDTPRPPPLSVWRPDEAGTSTHLQTGLACPPTFRGYKRTDLHLYDRFGLDVSCNYQAEHSDITVYLTRRARGSIADAIAEARREFLETRAGLHPQLAAETHPADGGLAWDLTQYNDDHDLRDGIWIADLDGWTLEYRATYGVAIEQPVLADIAAMTDLVDGSAGARLGLCGKAAPPERRGVAIADKAVLSSAAMMTAILEAGAQAASAAGKAVPAKAPMTWCAEQSLTIGGTPMLFWRGVSADGSDAKTDKLSEMTIDEPPALTAAPDELGNLVASAKKPTMNWIATTTDPKLTEVYGYFDGRPAPDILARLFTDVLAGKAQPLIGYSVDGKTINIAMPPSK